MPALFLVIAIAAILTAIGLWWIFRSKEPSTRVLLTLVGGQLLVTPTIVLVAMREAGPGDRDAWAGVFGAAILALVLAGLASFALEQATKERGE